MRMKIPNFKNGVIRESSSRSIGAGTCIGNLQRDAIREGGNSAGTGRVVGNTKDGVIYESSISSPGSGAVIGNVKDGWVYKSSKRGPGTGKKIGRVEDFTIFGMEREKDENIVAAWHFLVKKIF